MVQQPIQNSTCRLFVFSPVLCQTSRPRLKRPDNRCGNYFAFLCARVPALHTAVPVRPFFSRKYVSTKMMWPMANNVVLLSHVSWFGLFWSLHFFFCNNKFLPTWFATCAVTTSKHATDVTYDKVLLLSLRMCWTLLNPGKFDGGVVLHPPSSSGVTVTNHLDYRAGLCSEGEML